jgi:formylglycine-generating enzyme required for sulfatase activity
VGERGYKTEAEQNGKGAWGSVNGEWKRDPRLVWNGDSGSDQADDHPVVSLSWNDVTAFCTWLSEREQEESHLPTEAEWEYACRAGTTTAWYSGDDEGALDEYAWFTNNLGGKLHPVGQKLPNAWGLYDMHGNVDEWCQDWLGDRYYATSPVDDPPGPASGGCRVSRGSNAVAILGRAPARCWYIPSECFVNVGYRLARVVSSASASR